MAKPDTNETYKVPEAYSSMTIHHLYGLSVADTELTTRQYLESRHFALLADLSSSGIESDDIEEAVNSGEVLATHWPEKVPKTDFFWVEDEESIKELDRLATLAVQYCYGLDEHQPVGGNFMTVGAEIGSQQLALTGLIYAREKGKLREISELSDETAGTGPLYVVKDSFSARMFEMVFPES